MTPMQRGLNHSQLLNPKPNRQGVLQLDAYPADEMWGWGASMVRIHTHQGHWLADTPAKVGFGPGPATTSYRQAVIDAVNATTALGMGAMVSLVATGHGTGLPYDAPILKPMADSDAPTFWSMVAAEFKGNPLVVVDLFNEPHGIPGNVWRDGGTVTYRQKGVRRRRVTYPAVGMATLMGAVRQAGFKGTVCVSGTGWATDPTVRSEYPLLGAKAWDSMPVIMGQHAYPAEGNKDPEQFPPSLWNVPPAYTGRDVILSEFSWQWGQDGRFLRSVIDWCEGRQIGWLAYHYGPPAKTLSLCAPQMVDVGRGLIVHAPSACGRPVWDALASARHARGLVA